MLQISKKNEKNKMIVTAIHCDSKYTIKLVKPTLGCKQMIYWRDDECIPLAIYLYSQIKYTPRVCKRQHVFWYSHLLQLQKIHTSI